MFLIKHGIHKRELKQTASHKHIEAQEQERDSLCRRGRSNDEQRISI